MGKWNWVVLQSEIQVDYDTSCLDTVLLMLSIYKLLISLHWKLLNWHGNNNNVGDDMKAVEILIKIQNKVKSWNIGFLSLRLAIICGNEDATIFPTMKQ